MPKELVVEVEKEVREGYVCPSCGASKRADVFIDPEAKETESTVVVLECRACRNQEVRYYPG